MDRPMAWTVENRRTQVLDKRAEPYLTDAIRKDLAERLFPRYPTKRAVLLPALHAVQHETWWIPVQAMQERAAFPGRSSISGAPRRTTHGSR